MVLAKHFAVTEIASARGFAFPRGSSRVWSEGGAWRTAHAFVLDHEVLAHPKERKPWRDEYLPMLEI